MTTARPDRAEARQPRHTLRAVCAATLGALCLATGLAPAAAAAAPAAPPEDESALTDEQWAVLEAELADDGFAPVIVTLDTPARMPHEMSADQHASQRAAVARGQAALRAEMAGREPRHYKAMDDLPVVAFHADRHDLAALRRSKRVVSVVSDETHGVPDVASEPVAALGTGPGRSNGALVEGDMAPSATTNNGFANQLAEWWDYYRIGVNTTVANGYTGAGQTVAVLDTGVDRFHSWLSGDVVREACYSTPVTNTAGGNCPNGQRSQFGAGAAAPCRWAGCDHGTHVAHTAAGYWGVARGANVIAVQVFHYESIGPRVWDSDITWGLKYVYDLRASHRIAAVNMSLGGGRYTGYCDASFATTSDAGRVGGWINALKSVGIATVVASGNDNYRDGVSKPACFANAVSVGNSTLDAYGADAVFGNASYIGTDGRTYWTGSNSNGTLDLLAPGTDICSAVPGNRVDCAKGGTSMAAPHVAGAMAVLRAYRPAATVDQMVGALHYSGTSVYDSRNGITRSRINVWYALGRI
jgi:subtilisin family serine protease